MNFINKNKLQASHNMLNVDPGVKYSLYRICFLNPYSAHILMGRNSLRINKKGLASLGFSSQGVPFSSSQENKLVKVFQ